MRAFHPRAEHSALYGLTAETIAKYVRVHVTTARRWKRGEEPSYAALRLIEIVSTGDLELLDPSWSGWKLKAGKLVSPDNMSFSTGDVLSLTFLNQLIAHYQQEQRLPRQSDWISEKWVPAREIAVNE